MLDFPSAASRQPRHVSRSFAGAVAALTVVLAAMVWAAGAALIAPAVAQTAATEPQLTRAQRTLLSARLGDRLKMLERDTEVAYQRFRRLVDSQNVDKLAEVFDKAKSAEPLPNGAEDFFQRAIKDYVEYEPKGVGLAHSQFWPNDWPENRDVAFKVKYASCVGKRAQDFLLERQGYFLEVIKSIKGQQPHPNLRGETATPLGRVIRAALTINAIGAEREEGVHEKGIHWYMDDLPIFDGERIRPRREGWSRDELDMVTNKRRSCPIRDEDDGAGSERALGTVPLSVGWDGKCLQTDEVEADGTAKKLYHPTAAALMYNDGRTGLTTYCSGTLIAPNAVLTAAHCICDTRAKEAGGFFYRTMSACANGSYGRLGDRVSTLHPADQSVFLPHAGHFQISHVVVHPQFRWTDRLPVSDLAIVFLRRPVPAISPMPLNTLGRVRPSTLAAAVGYGAHNPLDASGRITSTTNVVESTGLKLHADVETGPCGFFERSRKLICWRYRTANRSGMTLGSTCRGDSGGPLYAISRGETYLVGVTSGGGPSCQPDPSSTVFDIEVFAYKDWIQHQLRTNPAPPGSWSASSPGRSASNGMKQAVCHFCPMCDQLTGSIKVPDNTRRVRVSVHCTPDDITRRSDIELRVSAKPDGTNLCVSEDPVWTMNPRGTALSCVVAEPQQRTLYVRLDSGLLQQCQIVATAFDQLD
jgi:hypothetical protein